MDFTMLFICLLVFMVIQALGTYVQVRQYKKAVRRLHKKGNVGIGSRRSRIKNNIVIIACNSEGIITDAEIMEGFTVFTNFKKIPDIIGKDIFELRDEYIKVTSKKEKKRIRGHLEAVKALCNRLECDEMENVVN